MSNPLDANGVGAARNELARREEAGGDARVSLVPDPRFAGMDDADLRAYLATAPLASSHTAVEPVALAQALKNLAEGAEQEEREILYAGAAALVAAEKEIEQVRATYENLEASEIVNGY